ncbi:20S proteasome [Alternaria alternata]|nr:20S proteasome [Alternaria alternata]
MPPRLHPPSTTDTCTRVCVQGDYGSKHHITGRAGQGLCSSHLAEEGARTYGRCRGLHMVLTLAHRTSSSTLPPCLTSSACHPQLAVS